MPTRNRGPHPKDHQHFATEQLPRLRSAADDLCFLLSRGYGASSATTLVGNRYRLNQRQRLALGRICVADRKIEERREKSLSPAGLRGQAVVIDGFNQLILLESLFSGAYVFRCRDGLLRDVSSVHGSYKRVLQTEHAIRQLGHLLTDLGVAQADWFLDRPVSNSGWLKTELLAIAAEEGYLWSAEVVYNPDREVAARAGIAISS
ncbi:MAG: DUF434 domain-containing protein, partial [Lewinella sp.]|nr:DUF434 domain-containing protein [Lewinella sp.]